MVVSATMKLKNPPVFVLYFSSITEKNMDNLALIITTD
jgi:hypothetical protein